MKEYDLKLTTEDLDKLYFLLGLSKKYVDIILSNNQIDIKTANDTYEMIGSYRKLFLNIVNEIDSQK